jgi:Tfp pilus assembly protein PilO
MMSSASPHQRMMIATGLVAAAILALLWVMAISPRKSESAEVTQNVATQEERLAAAQTQLASFQSSKKQYPGLLTELRRLDEAVPARGAISELLRQLQRRARVSKSELQVAALKPAGAGAPGATAVTPGAAPRAGGIAALPFTFTYTGKYFDLVKVLKAARRAVTVKSGDLEIDGRLVTIEGLTFERDEASSPIIKASVSGTAYIAAAPAPPTPAAPAAPTQGES